MKIDQFNNNPNVGTFIVLISIILLIFRLLQFVVKRYTQNQTKDIIKRILYLVECIFWFTILYQGIIVFKSKNMIFSVFCFIVLLLAVGWSSWFVLKDYLAGLYLKIEGAFKLNETIEFDGYTGIITSIGSRMLDLELTSSKIIRIPFHQFFVKRIIYTGNTENSSRENFVFKINPKYDAREALEEILIYIHQLPWTNLKNEQEVYIENSNFEGTFIRINASLFGKKYAHQFRQLVIKRFE